MSKTKKNIIIFILIICMLFGVIKIFNIPDKILKKMYPKTYSEHVEKYAKEYDVDPLLIYAVIKAESNFDEYVVSNSNAKGVMQLMDSTADEVASNVMTDTTFEPNMLFDAGINIKLGTKYLSDLLQKYNGNYCLAIAAYNAGHGNVDKWISQDTLKEDGTDAENIPYKETNNYVRKIVRDYGIYEKIY